MNSATFAAMDIRELGRFAHALRRKFTREYEAANSPRDIEILIDLADRAQEELETGHPTSVTKDDAAALATARRNLGRGQPRDLDQLAPDARRDAEFRLSASDALARIESVVQARLRTAA